MHINDLKLLIASKLDVLEFLDLIGYTMYDLVEVLEDEIAAHEEELSKAID